MKGYKMEELKNNPTMTQILADSYGGVLYNVANRGKYDTAEVLELWNNLTPAEQGTAGGIIEGAINFIKKVEV